MKKRFFIIANVLLILLLTSCVSTEFIENTDLAYDSWTITGEARKFMSDAEDAMLEYAAQSAWEKGFKYFIVENKDIRTDYSGGDYGIGTYYQCKASVIMFNDFEKIPNNYESYYVTKELYDGNDAQKTNTELAGEGILYGLLGGTCLGLIIWLFSLL